MISSFLTLVFYCYFPVFLQVDKNVFVIFYSGERAKSKILKICDAFGANRYPFTDDFDKQFEMTTEVHIVFFWVSAYS